MNKGGSYVVGKPKKTNQGSGKHSRPNHGRKKLRGQGK
mgnify:FL=1|tara:strand:+ start:282 stop:395 length:114 start_codon:yes stop_codon:yes gene_type:complete